MRVNVSKTNNMESVTVEKVILKHKWVLEDLIEQGRVTSEEIDCIKSWLWNEKYLPKLSDEQLAYLLLSCDKDQKFTQKTIKEYLKTRKDAPNLFTDRNLNRLDLQQQLETLEYSIFPKRTEDGCAIIFHRLHDPKYSNYNMEPAMKLLFMTLNRCVYENPPTGLIVLFDMKGVSLMHLTRVRLGLIRTFFNYLQEGLPIKLRAIHVFNIVYFIDKCLGIAKPFMKKEIYDMLHLHPSNLDMEKFYNDFIPKSCLPEDYGGDLPNTRILHEENLKALQEMRDYFEEEEKICCSNIQ